VAIRLARSGYSRLLAATTAAVALLVSGCAAGQISQTAQMPPAIDGANANAQGIGIRDVRFATPSTDSYSAGSSVPLRFWVSNTTLASDTLSSVSSPIAANAQITGTPQIPAQSLVEVGPAGKITVTLSGLKEKLVYGQSVPVTFTFATAGTMTVKVPIEIPGDRGTYQRETVNVLPPHPEDIWFAPEHGEEGEHGATDHAKTGASHAPSGTGTTPHAVTSGSETVHATTVGGVATTAAH
jgi:periplasmic copper chaperone A